MAAQEGAKWARLSKFSLLRAIRPIILPILLAPFAFHFPLFPFTFFLFTFAFAFTSTFASARVHFGRPTWRVCNMMSSSSSKWRRRNEQVSERASEQENKRAREKARGQAQVAQGGRCRWLRRQASMATLLRCVIGPTARARGPAPSHGRRVDNIGQRCQSATWVAAGWLTNKATASLRAVERGHIPGAERVIGRPVRARRRSLSRSLAHWKLGWQAGRQAGWLAD